MRRISVVFLGVAILMVTVADAARAGFGTGVIVGVMISRGQSVGSGDSNVLYVMPRVCERVKEPLEMKMTATYSMYFGPHSSDAGKSLKELFKETVTGSDKYEILQVTRVLDSKDLAKAVVWFVYIEKELVVPLEKLPKEDKN